MSALPKIEPSPFGVVPVFKPAAVIPAADLEHGTADLTVAGRWSSLAAIDIDRATLANPRLVAHDSGKRAMPFDGLRTKLCSHAGAKGQKKIAITSAGPGVGKSTIIANLALAFARAGDLRVLICELNQKKPALAAHFAINPRRDISEVLSGDLDFAEQGMRLQTSVAIAFSQHRSRGLLEAERPHDIHLAIDRLSAIYEPDLILYDLPNIYEDNATFSFLAGVDCAFAVARQDQCRLSALDECERHIASQTEFGGFIVSHSSPMG